ncbi:ABC transporter ATP-binding protein [Granulosicoccaceae sp. 1_MG-2023]|nr:ABC transporter ATP-binding protein [Granulosicoccaceae sp. 1_MG-2023]
MTSPEQSDNVSVLSAQALSRTVQGPEGPMTILDDVSLSVAEGEAVAIVGPSGSGKSTLLGLLAGLDVPDHGDVHLLGQSLAALDEDGRAQLRAGRVGFVFQSFHLLPGFTALENVTLALELAGRHGEQDAAAQLLGQLGLGSRLQHYPDQLSGGEQQRVALARAFVTRPVLLFADEPTGNLDAGNGEKTISLMFSLREEFGSSLVLVTHDPALAQRCDRSLSMQAGKLTAL